MNYRLRDGVSFCAVDGRTIFLDVQTGRYSMLLGRADAAFQLAQTDSPTCEVKQELDRLVDRQLLELCEDMSDLEETPPRAVTMSVLDRHWRNSVQPRLATVVTIGRTTLATKRHSLARLLAGLDVRRQGLDGDTAIGPAVEQMALEFTSARLFLPLRDRCLAESAALVDGLARGRTRASLVFGVTGRPFAAHCWVQIGNVVLNDTVEHVSAFRPILYA